MRIKIIAIVLVLCLLAGGTFFVVNRISIRDQDKGLISSFDENEITTGAMGGAPSVGNEGIFYINNDGILEFMDSASGKNTVVCTRANCTHESYSVNAGTECEADVHGFDIVIQQGASIYLIGHSLNDVYTDYMVYREDVGGQNREKIAEISGTMDLNIVECQADSRYLLMRYIKTYELTEDGKNIKNIEKTDYGFVIYNLKTKKSRVVSLGSMDLAESKGVFNINGYSLYKDGFDACVTCYDSGYSKDESDKLNGTEKERYESEHRSIHRIEFNIAHPEEYTDIVLEKGYGRYSKYINRRFFYVDDDGTLLYTDYSKKSPSQQKIQLEGIDSKTASSGMQFYGTDESYLYYSVVSKGKKEVSYYYCDLNNKKSYFVCDDDKYAIEGVSKENMYLCHVDSSGKCIRKVLKNSEFRESGLKILGEKSTKNSVSATKADDHKLVWKIWQGSQEKFGIDEKILNDYLKEKGKDYEIVLDDYDFFSEDNYETLSAACDSGDIISLPYEYNHVAENLIRENKVLPLNDLMQSSDVEEQFAQVQWNSVRVNGNIYAIPSSTKDYYGGYFLFNKKYFSEKDIKNFDCTLDGVVKLVARKNIHTPRSVFFETNSEEEPFFDAVIKGFYKFGMCFPDDGSDVTLWFDNEKVQEYYRALNTLYQKNVLITDMEYASISDINDEERVKKIIQKAKKASNEVLKGNFAIFIGQGDLTGKIKDTDDVYIVRSKTRNETNFGKTVAISAASDQADRAMDFLTLCYTDSAFADLLVYGKEGEKYEIEDGRIEPKNEDYSAVFEWNMELYNTYGINTIYHYKKESPTQWEYPTENDPLKNYKGIGTYDSYYTGKLFDISGYEKVCRKLISQEMKYGYQIYKAEDFEAAYKKLLQKFDRKEYKDFATHINEQK